MFEVARLLTKFDKLTVTWYQLEICGRPIGIWRVHTVPVVPLDQSDAVCIYPPKRRGPDQQRRKRPRRADADANDGDEGVEDDLGGIAEDAGGGEQDAPDEYSENMQHQGGLLVLLDEVDAVLDQPLAPPEDDDEPPPEPPQVESAGGVVSSDDPVAPPPPPPRPVEFRVPGHAKATVWFPHGKISYYPSKNILEAVCRAPGHGKCVLTRTVRARANTASDPVPKGGRPVGFLASWLLKAADTSSKNDHWANLSATLEERVAARNFVRQAPGGEGLLAAERTCAETEPEEAETLEGLL